MIYLERFRDDPLLLEAFESNLSEWVSGIKDPIPEDKPLHQQFEPLENIPESLERYWEISSRWPQIPLQGLYPDLLLDHEPGIFHLSDIGEIIHSSNNPEGYPEDPPPFLAFITGPGRAHGFGLRYDNKTSDWLLCEFKNREVQSITPFQPDHFMVDWGHRHFTCHEYWERSPGEFHTFADNANPIWNDGTNQYWHHHQGIWGRTFENQGKQEHIISVQSVEEISRIIGRELTPVAYITAPFVGTFYRSLERDAPPLVEIGTHVQPDTTVCIMEAVMVYNEITAEAEGIVSEVFVTDGTPVTYGQKMFRLT